jgi:hypothetical protein
MITTVSNPGYGGVGALVLSLDVFTRSRARLGRILLLAAVGCDPLITELAPSVNWKDAVDDTVDAKVSDGLLATVAAAQSGTGNDSNGTEDIFDSLAQGSIYDARDERDKPGREQATEWDMAPP